MPEQLAALVGSSSNEPLITSQRTVAVFKAAVAAGLKCVYISNGNTTREVLEYIRPYVSGCKLDLKTMSGKNDRRHGPGGPLASADGADAPDRPLPVGPFARLRASSGPLTGRTHDHL
jgi:hypothetical protein